MLLTHSGSGYLLALPPTDNTRCCSRRGPELTLCSPHQMLRVGIAYQISCRRYLPPRSLTRVNAHFPSRLKWRYIRETLFTQAHATASNASLRFSVFLITPCFSSLKHPANNSNPLLTHTPCYIPHPLFAAHAALEPHYCRCTRSHAGLHPISTLLGCDKP